MHFNQIGPALVSIAAVAVAALGYFLVCGSTFGALTDKPLRIAINPWAGYDPLYLAEVKGFYRAEGLNVELFQFSTLDDARRSFERGQVDAISTTLVDVVQVYHDTGESAHIAIALDYSNGSDVILAKSPVIRDITQLRGKRVGVEQMFGRFVLQRALAKHNLSLADVTMIEQSVLTASAPLAAGAVDAIVSYRPVSIDAMHTPGVHEIFNTREIPFEVPDVLALHADYARAHPGLDARLRSVWVQAITYLKEFPRESIEIMARRENISPAEFAQALAGVQLIGPEEMNDMLATNGPMQRSLADLIRFEGWKMSSSREAPGVASFLSPTPALGMRE